MSECEQKERRFHHYSAAERRELAEGLLGKRLFTVQHIENPRDISLVFLPIAFGALAEWSKEEIDQIGTICEYLHKAGERSINGLPSFFSCRVIHQKDWDQIVALYQEMKRAVEAVV